MIIIRGSRRFYLQQRARFPGYRLTRVKRRIGEYDFTLEKLENDN